MTAPDSVIQRVLREAGGGDGWLGLLKEGSRSVVILPSDPWASGPGWLSYGQLLVPFAVHLPGLRLQASSAGLLRLGCCSPLEELMLFEVLSHQALGTVSESCEIFFFLN